MNVIVLDVNAGAWKLETERGATTCQLYMRRFNDGDVITVEPWRSAGFPIIKDCMVDRSAF